MNENRKKRKDGIAFPFDESILEESEVNDANEGVASNIFMSIFNCCTCNRDRKPKKKSIKIPSKNELSEFGELARQPAKTFSDVPFD